LKIGFDLDGVIADIDILSLRIIDFQKDFKVRKELEKWYYSTRKVNLNPNFFCNSNDEIYIITSRFRELKDITKKWLDKNGIQYKKLLFAHLSAPYKTMSLEKWYKKQAELKANILNTEKIEVYFEDAPGVVKYLRKLCPNIKIIQYGDRLV